MSAREVGYVAGYMLGWAILFGFGVAVFTLEVVAVVKLTGACK